MIDDRVSPALSTCSTNGSAVNAAMTAAGWVDETRMSMSPVVSFQRRMLPAGAIVSTAEHCCSWRITSSAAGSAIASGMRCERDSIRCNSRRSASAAFSPRRGNAATWPLSSAACRSATVCTFSSWANCIARFGPMPGICISFSAASGTRSRRSSITANWPVVRYSRILAPMLLPTPWICSTRPSSAMTSIGS